MASPKLPEPIRARAIKAGKVAKVAALANGATPEEGHAAYRRGYNTVRANYLYAASPSFRRRNLEASVRWREAQA